jgi:hypothetical protein
MKIEDPRSDFSRPINQTTGTTGRPAADPAPGAGSDAVRFSGNVRLVHEAVQVAQRPVEVRSEAVARGRELIAQGLGNDLERLADGLIDAATTPHDDDHH